MLTEREKLAVDVLEAFQIKTLPVDVFDIARRERIELCPTSANSSFLGRIEFHPVVNRFLLFYPENRYLHENGRIRFSISHELAHYYIPEHHERLKSGEFHNSLSGFICDKDFERQADEFAAALLLPGTMLRRRLSSRSFLTLTDLMKLAEEARTSRECAAIRYAKFTEEPCVVAVSEGGTVLYSISSDEAFHFKCRLQRGATIPVDALTRRAASSDVIIDSRANVETWFPGAFWKGDLWEEAIVLGNTGRTLTVLALQKDDNSGQEESD